MDSFLPSIRSNILLAPALLLAGLAYGAFKFNTRVSPGIPYAGEQSLIDRLQAAGEYGKDPVEFLRKTRKQLGDVFCVDLLVVKIVFVLGAEGNKEVTRAVEDKLSFWDQVKWALGAVVFPSKYVYVTTCFPLLSTVVANDQEWVGLSTKLSRSYIMKQNSLDAHIIGTHCAKIVNEHFDAWAKQDAVPLFKSVSHLVISILLVLLLGEDFYRAHGEELVPLMSQFERDVQHPPLRITPNSLWRFTPPGKRIFTTCALFDKYVAEELPNLLAHPDELANKGTYFACIAQNYGDKFATYYGRHLLSLVFGGHANAAMTVPWLFLHARRTPGALDRIHEEAALSAEERRPFLEACFRETGRLYTNTSMMRMTKVPVRVAGHPIPKGTLVAASPLATQRADFDEDSGSGGIYKHAGSWDPTRFLNSEDALEKDDPYTKWFQRAEFVQFGLGVHACPGEKLARVMILDLILRTWMQKYDAEIVSGLEEGVKGVDGVGAEGAWTEENFGTPSVRGVDPLISFRRRVSTLYM